MSKLRGASVIFDLHGTLVDSDRTTTRQAAGHSQEHRVIEAVTTLPPIVIADLFGISPSTAETRAKYATDSWTVVWIR
ncbi:hypothetical protein ACFU3E_17410 [Streptomyces sp. NPDC057424]|uniref:hypothetical protein n=1 Tax=Streptomyces sp. NPDC057424 TaxID=3346127 RepID=UPI0036C1AD39